MSEDMSYLYKAKLAGLDLNEMLQINSDHINTKHIYFNILDIIDNTCVAQGQAILTTIDKKTGKLDISKLVLELEEVRYFVKKDKDRAILGHHIDMNSILDKIREKISKKEIEFLSKIDASVLNRIAKDASIKYHSKVLTYRSGGYQTSYDNENKLRCHIVNPFLELNYDDGEFKDNISLGADPDSLIVFNSQYLGWKPSNLTNANIESYLEKYHETLLKTKKDHAGFRAFKKAARAMIKREFSEYKKRIRDVEFHDIDPKKKARGEVSEYSGTFRYALAPFQRVSTIFIYIGLIIDFDKDLDSYIIRGINGFAPKDLQFTAEDIREYMILFNKTILLKHKLNEL